jgi:hypothetical protein
MRSLPSNLRLLLHIVCCVTQVVRDKLTFEDGSAKWVGRVPGATDVVAGM